MATFLVPMLKKVFTGQINMHHINKKTLRFFSLSLICAIVVFLFIQHRIVFVVEKVTATEQASILDVGDEIGRNGTREIFYIDQLDQKHFITESNFTNANPAFHGNEIVWMGQVDGRWQIFLYSLVTHSTIQLTHDGNNLNPSIYEGNVAWEGWVERSATESGWQVFYFDGEKNQIITQEDTAISPQIFNDEVFYSRKDETGEWKIRKYSPSKKSTSEIVGTENFKYFEFNEGRITKKRPKVVTTKVNKPKPKVEKRKISIPRPMEALMNFFSDPGSNEIEEASDEVEILEEEESPEPSPTDELELSPTPQVTAEDILKEIELIPTPFETPSASSSASPPAQPTTE